MHMVTARLGYESAMVGTGWANSCPGCIDRLRKRYSHRFCVSRKGGTGGGGWGHPQGDMHMVATRLGCSHLVGGSFLAGKVASTLSGCMTTESADYCMLVNEWAW